MTSGGCGEGEAWISRITTRDAELEVHASAVLSTATILDGDGIPTNQKRGAFGQDDAEFTFFNTDRSLRFRRRGDAAAASRAEWMSISRAPAAQRVFASRFLYLSGDFGHGVSYQHSPGPESFTR